MTKETQTTQEELEKRGKRTQLVMVMVLAGIQAENKQLEDLTPDEIKEKVNSAVADLKFVEDVSAQAN